MAFLIFVLIVANSLSDVSVLGGASSVKTEISQYPDPTDRKTNEVIFVVYQYITIINTNSYFTSMKGSSKFPATIRSSIYTAANGDELPRHILQDLTQFTRKRKRAIIDVYWLYDDGGLTLLLPYIISTRKNWESARLRVFALANKRNEIDLEMSSMASLLAKFRIDYSDLQLLTDISKKAESSTYYYFQDLIRNFTSKELCDNPDDGNSNFNLHMI